MTERDLACKTSAQNSPWVYVGRVQPDVPCGYEEFGFSVRMLKIRMTGDRESRGQLEKWLLTQMCMIKPLYKSNVHFVLERAMVVS